jgi:hypothetical protein
MPLRTWQTRQARARGRISDAPALHRPRCDAPAQGDTALLLHVVPSTYMALEPSLGLGGEGVFMSIPDPEAERLRVRATRL